MPTQDLMALHKNGPNIESSIYYLLMSSHTPQIQTNQKDNIPISAWKIPIQVVLFSGHNLSCFNFRSWCLWDQHPEDDLCRANEMLRPLWNFNHLNFHAYVLYFQPKILFVEVKMILITLFYMVRLHTKTLQNWKQQTCNALRKSICNRYISHSLVR